MQTYLKLEFIGIINFKQIRHVLETTFHSSLIGWLNDSSLLSYVTWLCNLCCSCAGTNIRALHHGRWACHNSSVSLPAITSWYQVTQSLLCCLTDFWNKSCLSCSLYRFPGVSSIQPSDNFVSLSIWCCSNTIIFMENMILLEKMKLETFLWCIWSFKCTVLYCLLTRLSIWVPSDEYPWLPVADQHVPGLLCDTEFDHEYIPLLVVVLIFCRIEYEVLAGSTLTWNHQLTGGYQLRTLKLAVRVNIATTLFVFCLWLQEVWCNRHENI